MALFTLSPLASYHLSGHNGGPAASSFDDVGGAVDRRAVVIGAIEQAADAGVPRELNSHATGNLNSVHLSEEGLLLITFV